MNDLKIESDRINQIPVPTLDSTFPISELPDEILAIILGSDKTPHQPHPDQHAPIPLVCRRWNEIFEKNVVTQKVNEFISKILTKIKPEDINAAKEFANRHYHKLMNVKKTDFFSKPIGYLIDGKMEIVDEFRLNLIKYNLIKPLMIVETNKLELKIKDLFITSEPFYQRFFKYIIKIKNFVLSFFWPSTQNQLPTNNENHNAEIQPSIKITEFKEPEKILLFKLNSQLSFKSKSLMPYATVKYVVKIEFDQSVIEKGYLLPYQKTVIEEFVKAFEN